VFGNFGLRGATATLIAERAGVAKARLFYYDAAKATITQLLFGGLGLPLDE
jgi:hypothetical protein